MTPPHDWKDYVLRTLIVICGVLAAILLAREGHAEALPGIAIGGAIGAMMVRQSEGQAQD